LDSASAEHCGPGKPGPYGFRPRQAHITAA
jgi:hypothetical protein